MFQFDLSTNKLGRVARAAMSTILLLGLVLLIPAPDAAAQYQLRKATETPAQASITVTEPAAGAIWEKGKRYTITWTSSGIRGGVKIDLVDAQGKVTSLARQTLNNGKYAFSLKPAVVEGDYKVRVSSTDGKTFGETASTVHVGGATTPRMKTPGQAPTPPPTKPPPTQPIAPLTTVTKPTSVDALQPVVSAADLVRREFTPMQVSNSELQEFETDLPDFSVATQIDLGALRPMNAGGSFEILQPQFQAEWIAGNQYAINWTSEDITGNVRIDLVQVASPTDETWYPVIASTPNDGHHLYTAPHNLGCKPWGFKARVATPDELVSDYSNNFSMYTESVDMACRVVDITQQSDTDHYVVYVETDNWLQFDVWLRNDGTMSPVTVQNVSVILIKEPEEVMVVQEEWGFSGIYPRIWYKTPEPRRFDIRESYTTFLAGDTEHYIPSGAFRLEVEIDPGNQLGEDQTLRTNNKVTKWFHIR